MTPFYSFMSSRNIRTPMSWAAHCIPVLDFLTISVDRVIQHKTGAMGNRTIPIRCSAPYHSTTLAGPPSSPTFRLLGFFPSCSFPSPSSLFRFTPAFASPCGWPFPPCTGGGGCWGFFFFTLRGLGPLAFFFRRTGASGLERPTGSVPRSGTVGCKADSSAYGQKTDRG